MKSFTFEALDDPMLKEYFAGKEIDADKLEALGLYPRLVCFLNRHLLMSPRTTCKSRCDLKDIGKPTVPFIHKGDRKEGDGYFNGTDWHSDGVLGSHGQETGQERFGMLIKARREG